MDIGKKHHIPTIPTVILIVTILLLPSCYCTDIKFTENGQIMDEKRADNGREMDRIINDDAIILRGNILANIDDNKLKIVRPSINLSEEQVINFNLTKDDSGRYFVNRTLRIDIDVINGTNASTILGRYITTCIVLRRQNCSLADGFLKNLFIGKMFNINRTNVFLIDKKYIEIPLIYGTDKESENIIMSVLAIGTIPGFLSKGSSIFAYKKIDLKFNYSLENPQDTIPPTTICILEGNEIE